MIKLLNSKYVLLVYFFCLFINANSQVTSFKQQKITIEALFDSLTNHTSIDIAYDVNAIPHDSVINANFQNKHALQIVQEVLVHQNVDISYLNGQIIISKTLETAIQKEKSIRLIGTVYDKDDGTTLPLVNVTVMGKPLGSITNNQGQYEFKLPSHYAGEQLAFSFLGYHTSYFNVPQHDSLINIELQPTSIQLNEIEVTYKDPLKIIEQLQNHYPENYINQQCVLEGFFRESIKQDGAYVQVSEAIIQIIKPSYAKPSSMERVKFIKGRKKNDLQSMDFVDFKLEGGPFQFSRVDIARYQDFFSADNELYKYNYDGIDVLDEEIVYKVKFKPLTDDGDLLYYGILYIHADSYALVRSEFHLTNRALRSSGRSLIRKASRKIKVKPMKASYFIDYRKLQDKWILNRIKGEIVVKINERKHKINSEFTATTELLISDCEVNGKYKLKPSELYKSRFVLADQIKETDEQFWKNYNIIRPDESLEKVFKKTKVVSN
ncbi:carboxypeptidase-like regulatory domain-containing protein [Carboxylicivirga sp. A043]|uniref:carboxypeptidase-like regulatory domain-containing protein n=1 Tax=Carboxylicivirga litoralis TaxID=2816963 RepID=UPI0021CB543E|nr:carboxypeptidase-like regulatory domain-containing protein [Carboxylicivirga sp. A043]MCU4154649.1 carboxypeptidase-like regulatory domain-containing protein [Carboxylicivirga sp. A043]